MSRTIRHRRTFAWYQEERFVCKTCGRTHGFIYMKPNVPECADGQYCETSCNRQLKDARRHTDRTTAKKFVTNYYAGNDIENIPYPCNKDIRMDYYLI